MSRTFNTYSKLKDLPIDLPKGAVKNWDWSNWAWQVVSTRRIRHHSKGGRKGYSCCSHRHNNHFHQTRRQESNIEIKGIMEELNV